MTSIQWLAQVTEADIEGLSVGSKTLLFIPKRAPTELRERSIKITADSGAASTLLIFQAVLPFLVFAGNSSNEPITLVISGGTNVSFSLSFEYLNQVLLPTLEERFDISVERQLKGRSWSLGSKGRGEIHFKIKPLSPGQQLHFRPFPEHPYPQSYEVERIDVSILTPQDSHDKLKEALSQEFNELDEVFSQVSVNFKIVEDSHNVARWSILLVATSKGGFRWGKDVLLSMPKKTKDPDAFATQVSRKICKELYEEIAVGGQVDEYLQDQIVCFQALCDGFSSLPRGVLPDASMPRVINETGGLNVPLSQLRREKSHQPFGRGSLHTQTARWVAAELLPAVKFFNKGDIVEGVGFSIESTGRQG